MNFVIYVVSHAQSHSNSVSHAIMFMFIVTDLVQSYITLINRPRYVIKKSKLGSWQGAQIYVMGFLMVILQHIFGQCANERSVNKPI